MTQRWLPTALVVFLSTLAVAAQAQTARSFVASTGSDANTATNCPRSNPCRFFGAAFGVTNAGGEVVALDSAGFGGLPNINKAITIEALPGQLAFINTAGVSIAVNAGVGDTVTLRNLQINGSGGGTVGVQFNAGNTLLVEHCVINGFSTTGLAASTGLVFIQDSTFTDNGTGIQLTSGAKGEITNTEVRSNNNEGLVVQTAGKAVVFRSKFVGNSRGAYATNANSEIFFDNSVSSYNAIGLKADNTATGGFSTNDGGRIFVNGSVITNNTTKAGEGATNSFAIISRCSPALTNTVEGNPSPFNDFQTITGGSCYSGK